MTQTKKYLQGLTHGLILMFAIYLSTFMSTAHASPSCFEYLSSEPLSADSTDAESSASSLLDSVSFNTSLGQISSAKALKSFIYKFSQSLNGFSAQDKRTFVRSGLFELEKISIPLLEASDVPTRESLLRLMTNLRYRNLSVEFVNELERVSQLQIADMEARNLSAYIYLMGKLGIKPSALILQAVENEFINRPQDIEGNVFNPQNLSNTVYGMALMGYVPTEHFLTVWRERYQKIQGEFLTLNIVNSLFSFYVFGADNMVRWMVRATTAEQWDLVKKRPERRQVSLVYEYYEKIKNIRLQPIIQFKGQFKDLMEKPTQPQSEIEEAFELRLAMSGMDYEVEYKTTPGFYVDFFVPEKNQVIQVDGPSHFIRENIDGQWVEKQRPQDLLIDEVLKFYGYDVRRRSYHQIN